MRRILTTALASSLLALALPAAASAHHGSRHGSAHRAKAHRHHHKRAHTVVFAPRAKPSGTTTTTGTGTPSTPTEPVATVASFENGVLKITLADGSTVSGKVTEQTEISCGCSGHDGSFGGSGWQGGDNNDENDNSDDNGGPSGFHGDDEHGSPEPPKTESTCGVSALVAGAKVKEAELHVSGAGAVWEKVELLPKA